MKRTSMLRAISNVLLGMIVVLGGWPGVTGAATTSISVPVSAVIQAALEFDVTLLQNGVTPATEMDFGILTKPFGVYNATVYYQAWFGVNTSGDPYTVSETAASLVATGGTTKIPDGAFVVTPLDGVGGDPTKPLPAGSAVGPQQSAVGTGIILFSNSAGAGTVYSATYGLTSDPSLGSTEIIPGDQKHGTYTTVVTWTLTTT